MAQIISVKGLGNNQKSLASFLSEHIFWPRRETLQLPLAAYHDPEVSLPTKSTLSQPAVVSHQLTHYGGTSVHSMCKTERERKFCYKAG